MIWNNAILDHMADERLDPEKIVQNLKKDFTLVSRPRVRLVYFYLALAILLGAAMALIYVAERTP